VVFTIQEKRFGHSAAQEERHVVSSEGGKVVA